MPIPADQPLVLLWQSLWHEHSSVRGLEHVVVQPGFANGVILGLDASHTPYRIQYEIEWDENWRTREVDIDVMVAQTPHSFHLSVDEHAHWFDGDGRELSEFAGCFDVDIWPTPFTNTLAVRRLALAPGERELVTVVWVDALAGEIMTARQAYTCLDHSTYRFESLERGFIAELAVDDYGLVVDYPGLFERCAGQR